MFLLHSFCYYSDVPFKYLFVLGNSSNSMDVCYKLLDRAIRNDT